MTFKLEGVNEMRAKLQRIAGDFPRRIEQALNVEAEEIMTISKRDYVPVDLGALRSSGKVESVKRVGTEVSVSMQYGDTAAPYALTVHEHGGDMARDPPSWRGTQVTFHPSGRGPKYLEIPLMQRVAGMAQRVANKLKL